VSKAVCHQGDTEQDIGALYDFLAMIIASRIENINLPFSTRGLKNALALRGVVVRGRIGSCFVSAHGEAECLAPGERA